MLLDNTLAPSTVPSGRVFFRTADENIEDCIQDVVLWRQQVHTGTVSCEGGGRVVGVGSPNLVPRVLVWSCAELAICTVRSVSDGRPEDRA